MGGELSNAAKSEGGVDALAAANTRFALNLLAEILKEDSDKNIFISPFSVSAALLMTWNGAAGDTQAAMAQALALGAMDRDTTNQAYAALRDTLADIDPLVTLAVANSLWGGSGEMFKPAFLRRCREVYDAEIQTADFLDPETVTRINEWVSEKTNEKITEIIKRLSPDTLLVLLNAIYFKGEWAEKFDESATQEQPFTLPDGTARPHPTMHQSGKYPYYEDKTLQAVRLPYGAGRMGMYIFLPAPSSSLSAFLGGLDAAAWADYMDRFYPKKGEIALPRFKLEYEITLNGALCRLGMAAAFGGGADFGEMTLPPAFISLVKHKAFVEVNEAGTEAAAVTMVVMTRSLSRPFRMVVDRPFFFAICDDETDTILFMGVVLEP